MDMSPTGYISREIIDEKVRPHRNSVGPGFLLDSRKGKELQRVERNLVKMGTAEQDSKIPNGYSAQRLLYRIIRGQKRKELRRLRLARQRALCQLLQQRTVAVPGNGNNCADIAFHSLPGDPIGAGNIRVERFGHTGQPFQILQREVNCQDGLKKAAVIGGNP